MLAGRAIFQAGSNAFGTPSSAPRSNTLWFLFHAITPVCAVGTYQKIHCKIKNMTREIAAQKTGRFQSGKCPSLGSSVHP